jgi:hypothetical protein
MGPDWVRRRDQVARPETARLTLTRTTAASGAW